MTRGKGMTTLIPESRLFFAAALPLAGNAARSFLYSLIGHNVAVSVIIPPQQDALFVLFRAQLARLIGEYLGPRNFLATPEPTHAV